MKKYLLGLMAWGLVMSAHGEPSLTAAEQAVASTLRAQWEKPDLALELPVIVVQADVAIADWILGEKGGRALLRQQYGKWQTLMCGGAELNQPHRLQQAGLSSMLAHSLADHLRLREQQLTPSQKQRIESFQGVMDFTHEHTHSEHHEH